MDDFSDSVMIALLPTEADWCKQDLPHTTLVFAGETLALRPTLRNEMAKVVVDIAMANNPIKLKVLGSDIFGDENKVAVLLLDGTPQLMSMRAEVQQWDASEHPFRPHVTIGPIEAGPPEVVPLVITFDRICVGWGDEYLIYPLDNNARA
jgi:2'-5' RNA ligase